MEDNQGMFEYLWN